MQSPARRQCSAGRLLGVDRPGRCDRRYAAGHVHGSAVPVGRVACGRTVRNAHPQPWKGVRCDRVDEVQNGVQQGKRLRADEHDGVADRLHELNGVMRDLSCPVTQPVGETGEVLRTDRFAEASEPDEVSERHRDVAGIRQCTGCPLGRVDGLDLKRVAKRQAQQVQPWGRAAGPFGAPSTSAACASSSSVDPGRRRC